jgi:hypothetical protein
MRYILIYKGVDILYYGPELSSQYVELVFNKVSTLIKYGVWGNVTMERFKSWKMQFTSEEEQYFAAYLAFQLLYYNNKDFLALISWAFSEAVRQIYLALEGFNLISDQEWKDIIIRTKAKILICPFAVDTPAASGNMITRLLRNQGLISEANICPIDRLDAELSYGRYKAVVFVDDIIGSGDQARDFFFNFNQIGAEKTNIRKILDKYDVMKYLAVAIASCDSLSTVELHTGLKIITAEKLTDRNSTLNRDMWFSEDYDRGMEFLKELENKYDIPRVGHKDSSWAVAFEHGVPDVSSPFYWYEPQNWVSIIPRRGVTV